MPSWYTYTYDKQGTSWTLTVGGGNIHATTVAAAAFSVWRNDLGLESKVINIHDYAPDPNTCETWTSSLNPASDYTTGIANIQMTKATTSCPSPSKEHRDDKFRISHEIGHTLMRLGDGGQEDYEPYKGETDLLTNNKCTNGEWYGVQTLEHNVIAAKEGFAEFYSAIVWNTTTSSACLEPDSGCTGNLHGWNLELNPIWTDIHRSGGRISCGPSGANCQSGSPHADCCGGAFEGCWDCCCNPTSTDGKGITMDWVRALWDWHTPSGSGTASATQIRQVWGQMMKDHFSGVAPIANEGDYYRRTKRAVGIEVSSSLESDWDYYAGYNGIDVASP